MPPKTQAATRFGRATRAFAKRTNPTTASPSSIPESTAHGSPQEAPPLTPTTAIVADSIGTTTPRSTRASVRRSTPSNSSVETIPKSVLEDRPEVTLLETLAAGSNAKVSPSLSSGHVRAEDAVKAPSCPTPTTASLLPPEFTPETRAESIVEKSSYSKSTEMGENDFRKETLAETTSTSIEPLQSHQIVFEKPVKIASCVAIGSESVDQKPVVRRSLRVVRKVVKKKVLRKVPKSALESLIGQSEKPQAQEVENPIAVVENLNSSVSSDKQSGNVEVPGSFEDPDPLVSVSVEEIGKLENSEVQGTSENPNSIFPDSFNEVENPVSSVNANLSVPMEEVENVVIPVSIDVENPTTDVSMDLGETQIVEPNEPEFYDGSAEDVLSKDQGLNLGEAQITKDGVRNIISSTGTAAVVPNADSIGKHNENMDSGGVEIKEVVEISDAHVSLKGCEVSNGAMILSEEMEALGRRKRRKTELFIGGLDKDAKEEDIRQVFEEVGKVVEVRLVMKGQTGKNKGYAFLRYSSATDAKKALEKYSTVKICGRECGASPVEGNDTIFLGNIDKKWKNEDIMKLLHDIGIDKIDTLTVMPDPGNIEYNRGFAFLELETTRDAQNAFKKLQRKDVFGKHVKINVAWAEPLVEPDEEEMLKVKSVYAEFVPSSWDEDKVKDFFKRFGEVDNVVLARNLHSSKRKDFAFVHFTKREAALTCIELFSRELIDDEGSKVNMKVSIAKPIPKGKHNKRASNYISKEIPKEKLKADTQRVSDPTKKGKYFVPARNDRQVIKVDRSSSTNAELIQLLREQASLKQLHAGLGPVNVAYPYSIPARKRSISALGDDPDYSDPSGHLRTRVESSYPVASLSYDSFSHAGGMASLPYHQRHAADYRPGYELTHYRSNFQREEAPYHRVDGLYRKYR